jgi:hypothetical protein
MAAVLKMVGSGCRGHGLIDFYSAAGGTNNKAEKILTDQRKYSTLKIL